MFSLYILIGGVLLRSDRKSREFGMGSVNLICEGSVIVRPTLDWVSLRRRFFAFSRERLRGSATRSRARIRDGIRERARSSPHHRCGARGRREPHLRSPRPALRGCVRRAFFPLHNTPPIPTGAFDARVATPGSTPLAPSRVAAPKTSHITAAVTTWLPTRGPASRRSSRDGRRGRPCARPSAT